MNEIKFGTDGWRAVVGKDFNQENVAVVTKAIGKYVFDNYGIFKPIIIGYDSRNMAKEFSDQCAQILSDFGFKVLCSDKVIPTPVLAFSARELDACAVMFTASHNPPEYLGIKFIPDYAGPATKEITDEIVSNFSKDFETGLRGKIFITDFSDRYFKHINNIVDFEKIKTLKTNILYDGLYSASIGYFNKLLSMKDVLFDSMHLHYDPKFGGVMPEPKPEYMLEAIEYVKSKENYIALANDGDADRFGVINEDGGYVTPNEILAILLMHLKKNKGYKGCFVKTVAGSLMLNIVCDKLGVEVIETPVGFKYVGEAMREYNPIIAGEESGGLSVQGHIPEKDGILANLLILEAMAYEGKSLVQMQKELKNFVGGEFVNKRLDKILDSFDQVNTTIAKFKTLSEINGLKISKTDEKDGLKIYFEDKKSWILVRPSGTEPLLRIYFESDTRQKIDEFLNYVKNLV